MAIPTAPTTELDGLDVEQAQLWRPHIGHIVLLDGKPRLVQRLSYGEQGADHWSVTVEPVKWIEEPA